MNLRPLLLLATAFPALPAQTLTVSPVAFATTEGNSSSTTPFTQTQVRMQQVHGDLKGTPRVITAMSFRRDGLATLSTGLSRTLDMELAIGDADYKNFLPNYAGNYIGAPKVAIARKNVVTTAWNTPAVPPPAAFDFTMVFDAPVLHTGTQDLLWDIKVFANSGTTTDAVRADAASPLFTNASGAILGTACTTTGASQSYQLLGTIGALSNVEYRFGPQGFPTPASSTSNVLLVGLSDPNLTVPGLCTNVRSSGEVPLPMPNSDAAGTWTQQLLYFPGNGWYAGATMYWQAVSLDLARPTGLPITMSAGRQIVVPAIPAGTQALAKRASHFSLATATDSQSISDGGLVVQFTHF